MTHICGGALKAAQRIVPVLHPHPFGERVSVSIYTEQRSSSTSSGASKQRFQASQSLQHIKARALIFNSRECTHICSSLRSRAVYLGVSSGLRAAISLVHTSSFCDAKLMTTHMAENGIQRAPDPWMCSSDQTDSTSNAVAAAALVSARQRQF